MERLTRTGSSSALRRVLFPAGFAGEVMSLIHETWQSFTMHRDVRHEERLTAVFADALIDAYDKKGWPWTIVSEGPITDPIFGTQVGRNDLRFLHHKVSQRIFFTVECKRLHVTTESGFKYLANEYVKDGLLRFVEGKYAADRTCGGMVGYVFDNDVARAFEQISNQIATRRKKLKIKSTLHLRQPSSVLPNIQFSADTMHVRNGKEFVVHHLLLGVIRCGDSRQEHGGEMRARPHD